MAKVRYYLQLMRPANIMTAIADICAGSAAAGAISFLTEGDHLLKLLLLMVSTAGLYGGGVVFNDVFDAGLDAKERPERPIPSGKVSSYQAKFLGCLLFIIGIICAFIVSIVSGAIAVLIMMLALLYDKYAKHHVVAGPAIMGSCRSFNLLLGISIINGALTSHWYLAFIPLFYIAGITLISRGEVHGRNNNEIKFGAVLWSLMIIGITSIGLVSEFDLLRALPFLVIFIIVVSIPLTNAMKYGSALYIRKAVKTAVISLILLDASIAAGYSNIWFGAAVLILMPMSIWLAKSFAVT